MIVKFITLTNKGYLKYTLNCIESLERLGIDIDFLTCYCIDDYAHKILSENRLNSVLIENNKYGRNSKFETYHSKGWNKIMMQKFYIIYENLIKYDYVLFTDGDIVFENCDFIEYLLDNIKDKDLLIQNEYGTDSVCAGFMFFRSNDKTKHYMNPKNVLYKEIKWDDQIYMNSIKTNLKYEMLDLELFPNGKYYMEMKDNLNPYIIHFNWLIGNEKIEKMKENGKWYI